MQEVTSIDVNSDSASWTAEQPRGAVVEFLNDFAVEAAPHSLSELDSHPEFLKRGTTLCVAHPPIASLDDVLHLVRRPQPMGYRAVPHLAARRIESRTQLDQALTRLQSVEVNQALLIAGDLPRPVGPYRDTMQFLETELLALDRFRTVGIAGHPEGARAMGAETPRRALRENPGSRPIPGRECSSKSIRALEHKLRQQTHTAPADGLRVIPFHRRVQMQRLNPWKYFNMRACFPRQWLKNSLLSSPVGS